MSNIVKATEILTRLDEWLDLSPENAVEALADAGLIAPELPQSSPNRHHGWWAAKGAAYVSIAPEERVILEFKEDDALFTPAEAREVALALLAAVNYAEEANQ